MNFRLAFVGVLIAGTAIGVAMPEVVGESMIAPAPQHATTAQTASGEATLNLAATTAEPDFSDSLTIQREDDGHFYADVSVDGQSTRMMVDTGASVIALTGEDAAALGIVWDEADVQPVARGANDTVYGVTTVLPLVELGGLSAENVPAMVIPEGLFVSLLGQSFLSKVAKLEMAGDALVVTGQ